MTVRQKREKNRLRNIEWRKNNREKCCRATAAWRNKNPEYERRRKLKGRYGITLERYIEMFNVQSGRCAICRNRETAIHNGSKREQRLAVDHCHQSGKIRGLLCQDCNRGLGHFHDDILKLQKVIRYIRATKKSRLSTAL